MVDNLYLALHNSLLAMAKSKRKYGRKKSRGRKGRRKKRSGGKKRQTRKVAVKRQFKQALARLRRMTPVKQREAILGSSSRFINDITNFMKKIRHKAHLVKPSHRRILKRHKKKLQKLVHPKTTVRRKRLILSQKGGFISILLPIIVALIGAGGSIGAGAVGAAIMKG